MVTMRTMFDPEDNMTIIKVGGLNGLPEIEDLELIKGILSGDDVYVCGSRGCAKTATLEDTVKALVADRDRLKNELKKSEKSWELTNKAALGYLDQIDKLKKETSEKSEWLKNKNEALDNLIPAYNKLEKENKELKKELEKTKDDFRRNNEMFESFSVSRDTLLNKKDKEIEALKAALANAESKYRNQLTATHNIAEKYNALLQEGNINYKEKYEKLKHWVDTAYTAVRDCLDDDCAWDYETASE